MKFIKYVIIISISISFFSCEEEDPTSSEPEFTISDATDITESSALIRGSVSGTDVIEKGVVYAVQININQTLDENDRIVSLGSGSGDVETRLEGLSDNTNYIYGIYAVNTAGDFEVSFRKIFSTLEDTTSEPTQLALGDTYEGGIIYYLDGTGEHGLLAAPEDQTTGSNWDNAMDVCFNYSLDGNSNWRLPDLDELEFLYSRRSFVNGFSNIAYWSSSVEGSNNNLSYGVFFGTGSNAGQSFVYNKTDVFQHSRAIRDF